MPPPKPTSKLPLSSLLSGPASAVLPPPIPPPGVEKKSSKLAMPAGPGFGLPAIEPCMLAFTSKSFSASVMYASSTGGESACDCALIGAVTSGCLPKKFITPPCIDALFIIIISRGVKFFLGPFIMLPFEMLF